MIWLEIAWQYHLGNRRWSVRSNNLISSFVVDTYSFYFDEDRYSPLLQSESPQRDQSSRLHLDALLRLDDSILIGKSYQRSYHLCNFPAFPSLSWYQIKEYWASTLNPAPQVSGSQLSVGDQTSAPCLLLSDFHWSVWVLLDFWWTLRLQPSLRFLQLVMCFDSNCGKSCDSNWQHDVLVRDSLTLQSQFHGQSVLASLLLCLWPQCLLSFSLSLTSM